LLFQLLDLFLEHLVSEKRKKRDQEREKTEKDSSEVSPHKLEIFHKSAK